MVPLPQSMRKPRNYYTVILFALNICICIVAASHRAAPYLQSPSPVIKTDGGGLRMTGDDAPTEQGMHVTWLVRDVTAFQKRPGPTSEHDRPLPFGLTYREWYALYFDVLDVDHGAYKRWLQEHREAPNILPPIEFEGEVAGYPLLSRICGYLCDAVFELDEVEELRQECQRVRAATTNQLALKGIDKLLRMCAEAQKLRLNIYLMCE